MIIKLYEHQQKALQKMKNGCILCGGVGSGKSRTSLAYYYKEMGGKLYLDTYTKMKDPKDLYIITTARKRDTKEWELELSPFLLSSNPELNAYTNKVVIDSWNNIKKYKEVTNSFFIFDEQRVVGYGAWTKSFLKIAKSNNWILLSATPGDTWMDYAPVFIANGFYKNITEFRNLHAVYSKYTDFPRIERFVNTGRLVKLRRDILVDMPFKRPTTPHHEDVWVNYDDSTYKFALKDRWNPYKNEPIQNASSLCYILRRIVNSDESRVTAVQNILLDKWKAIIFYNFDYELEILKFACNGIEIPYSEWNGHIHDPIPKGEFWAYLVQYTAGAEGWNCTSTDTIIFFSQNYSYKVMVQSSGRIDRLNTDYTDLYFYHLKSRSGIDLAISKALNAKKKFNEKEFVG